MVNKLILILFIEISFTSFILSDDSCKLKMATSEMSLYKEDISVYSQGKVHNDWGINPTINIKADQEIEYFYITDFDGKDSNIVYNLFNL